jgi:hypothetical protein
MTKIDSRLYHGTTARLAKKHIGWSLCKLKYAVDLKPGDLLSTCKGYNERIAEVYPEWTTWNMRRGAVICDFNFTTETGCSCSAIHCCSFPLETRDQIYDSWKRWLPPANATQAEIDEVKKQGWGFVEYAQRLEEVLAAGGHAFDEDGQPYYEFCLHDWERKIRFPERWKQDVEVNFGEIVKREITRGYGRFWGGHLVKLFDMPREEIEARLKQLRDWEAIFERIWWE